MAIRYVVGTKVAVLQHLRRLCRRTFRCIVDGFITLLIEIIEYCPHYKWGGGLKLLTKLLTSYQVYSRTVSCFFRFLLMR